MWKNVGNDKIQKMEGKKFPKEVDQIDSKKRRYWRVDCQSASKGLFLGKVDGFLRETYRQKNKAKIF